MEVNEILGWSTSIIDALGLKPFIFAAVMISLATYTIRQFLGGRD